MNSNYLEIRERYKRITTNEHRAQCSEIDPDAVESEVKDSPWFVRLAMVLAGLMLVTAVFWLVTAK